MNSLAPESLDHYTCAAIGRLGREGTLTTLRPCSSLWRRTRCTILAGSVALSTLVAPVGVALADNSDSSEETAPPSTSGFTISVSDASELSGLTAQVSADGDGLILRAEPSADAAVVAILPDGTIVDLRVDVLDTVYDTNGTRWWPVAVGDETGWVSGFYLVEPGTGPSDRSGVPLFKGDFSDSGTSASTGIRSEFTWEGGELEGATAVASTGGGNLQVRAEPSATSEVVERVPDGTVVDLRIDMVDTVLDANGTRWWPVAVGGHDGWVSGFFLSDGTEDRSAPAADGTSGSVITEPSERVAFDWDGEELEGATAIVVAGGNGASVYSEPSAESTVVTTVINGATVNLRISDVDTVYDADGVTRWWPVEANGATGWMSGFDLTAGSAADQSASVPATDSQSEGVFPSGSTAMVQTESGQGLRVRAAAGTGSEHIFSLTEGSQVTIVDGPVSFDNSINGWFEISADGGTGFADGDLLVLVSTPEPTSVPVTPTVVPTEPPAVETDGQVPGVSEADSTEEETDSGDQGELVGNAQTPSSEDVGEADEPVATETPETDPTPSGPMFIAPVEDGTRTQGFGCSSLGFYPYNPDWGCGVHDGVDYAAASGTPILASAGGTVTFAGWCDCGLGYYVEIDHGNGVTSIYGHMASQPYVSSGQQVAQGETIGPVGSTGLSTGPHVHFMIQVNGVSQDPSRYLG